MFVEIFINSAFEFFSYYLSKNCSIFQTFKVLSSDTEAINFPNLGEKATLEISAL